MSKRVQKVGMTSRKTFVCDEQARRYGKSYPKDTGNKLYVTEGGLIEDK